MRQFTDIHLGLAFVAGGLTILLLVWVWRLSRSHAVQPSPTPIDDPKRVNFITITPEAQDKVLDDDLEAIRTKMTLKLHVESLQRCNWIMIDGEPHRYRFCIGDSETTPFGKLYVELGDESCHEISIDDQRRVTAPPEWYDHIDECRGLVYHIKDVAAAMEIINGVPSGTYEKPFKVVRHGHFILPVLRVYKDMTWFDDRRWAGPVIVANANGTAEGVIPPHEPATLEQALKDLYEKACVFWKAIPPEHEQHQELSKHFVSVETTIKEFLARVEEVEETREGV